MNVLVLGANGYLGPHVIKALEQEHTLRLTDINDLDDTPHEYFKLDVSDLDAVVAAAEGMDAIVNLSVLRHDGQLAFDVSARGAYNMMVAAVEHGIGRVINTGPHFTVAGPTYERIDYEIGPDVTPQPGTNLYALTKSLGPGGVQDILGESRHLRPDPALLQLLRPVRTRPVTGRT